MDEQSLYGKSRFAELLGVSESTITRWLKTPEGAVYQTDSMSNAGGGLGKAYLGIVGSLQNLKEQMAARTSAARRCAAGMRWHPSEVSSGPGM